MALILRYAKPPSIADSKEVGPQPGGMRQAMIDDIASFGPVRNGIDVLAAAEFDVLRNRRVAIVTNHTGRLLDGTRTVDALVAEPEVHVDVIFSPEHGFEGLRENAVGDSVDEVTGVPIFSLFGDRVMPSPEQLTDIDVVLFDIQDVGARFYSYISTLGYTLEACAENRVEIYVLDRPNPIGGFDVEGPSSDAACESFTAYHSLPLRHGMTIGELSRLFNVEREIGANLRVVTMAGWQRSYWFDNCGQTWIAPSPNIRDLQAAALYPGLGLLEGTNVSVGRGTPEPFHVFGAPWMDGTRLAEALTKLELPGLVCEPFEFTPDGVGYPHHGQRCHGVRFRIGEKQSVLPSELALALIRELRVLHPVEWRYSDLASLLARPDLLDAIEDGSAELDDLWEPDPEFFEARARAMLY
jgi:uncharacterized protein YbbC (DUF1343 family)